ncbi:MAG: polysaccharide biosynthesis C-terminal domain-containing protein [Bacteroidota bacterium]|nr:polysaccharide biosynthesis C-terminal domain-containing protein [Bacteroidota bacterium]
MGIIQKQAIRGSVYSYLGVGLGFVINLLIYQKYFEADQIGLLRLLVAYSALFAQFASLGFPRVTTVIFPYFRNYQKKHHGFFFLAFLVSTIGLIISILLLFILQPAIIGKETGKSMLLAEYFFFIVPLIIVSLYYIVFDNYYKVLYNSVQGTFLKEFLQRVLILGVALLFVFGLIDFREFVLLFFISFLIPTLLILFMLIRDRQIFLKPQMDFISKDLRNRMVNIGFYGILTSFSGILVLNIDSIMINAMIDLSSTGIYAITFYFGTVILVSSRPLLKISSVVIADAWKNNDQDKINTIYYKSCLNQTILASLLFIGIWANIHNVFNEYLLQSTYEPGKYVIFFISLASTIQMAGGTSNMILFTSPKYKIHTYFMILLVLLLVGSNLVLIPALGIVGAALASAVSFLVFNLLKYFYLKKQFGFHPYDHKILLVVFYAVLTYFLSLLIPRLDFFAWDILLRSTFISIFYLCLVLMSNISGELNEKYQLLINYFKRRR